jgi:hypothetical protein
MLVVSYRPLPLIVRKLIEVDGEIKGGTCCSLLSSQSDGAAEKIMEKPKQEN